MIAWLEVLDRKLVRDLRHIWGQVIAIALVIAAGVATMVVMSGTLRSLSETQEAYYERYRFADVFATARRAPESLAARIAEIPGVARVDTRIVEGMLLDMPGLAEPVQGQVLSVEAGVTGRLNDLVLRVGRLPEPGRTDEVVVNEAFAEAHGLRPGDRLAANLGGNRRQLTVVGIALSPEFIYAIAPGSIVPDNLRFGVFWMGRGMLEAAFDLRSAFNEVSLTLTRGAVEQDVVDAVDRLLAPHGGAGAHGREYQLSHAFIQGELDQLGVMAAIVPPIFLAVAAFLLNLVIGRLIDTEREQIGLLKAFGYSNAAVGWHYLKFVLVISLIGVLAGFGVGAWLGRGMTQLYAQFYSFPFLYFSLDTATFATAGLLSLGVSVLGALMSVRRAVRLEPAVAMRPPPPATYRRTVFDRIGLTWVLGSGGRMILRNLVRWPVRAALTAFGIALSVALLVSTLFFLDSIDRMIEIVFFESQRENVSVTFAGRVGEDVVWDLQHQPGVLHAELSRSVPARLVHGALSERTAITGLDPGGRLRRLLTEDGEAVDVPESGLVLSDLVAQLLGARPGDALTVEILEGRRPVLTVPVVMVVKDYVGRAAYMDRSALNRLVGEGAVATGALLAVDMAQADALYTALSDSPAVAGVVRRTASLEIFEALLDETMVTMVLFYVAFASVIAVGVVYNSARISLTTRARELASMRVLGFYRYEVAVLLLGELAVLTLLAIPIGSLLGYAMAAGMVEAFATEQFRLPLLISPTTYAYAALVVVAAALGTGALVARRVARLDLIAVLKTRD